MAAGSTQLARAGVRLAQRLGLVISHDSILIFDPVWYQTSGAGQHYWWPKLQCLTSVYRELRCAEIFDA